MHFPHNYVCPAVLAVFLNTQRLLSEVLFSIFNTNNLCPSKWWHSLICWIHSKPVPNQMMIMSRFCCNWSYSNSATFDVVCSCFNSASVWCNTAACVCCASNMIIFIIILPRLFCNLFLFFILRRVCRTFSYLYLYSYVLPRLFAPPTHPRFFFLPSTAVIAPLLPPLLLLIRPSALWSHWIWCSHASWRKGSRRVSSPTRASCERCLASFRKKAWARCTARCRQNLCPLCLQLGSRYCCTTVYTPPRPLPPPPLRCQYFTFGYTLRVVLRPLTPVGGISYYAY